MQSAKQLVFAAIPIGLAVLGAALAFNASGFAGFSIPGISAVTETIGLLTSPAFIAFALLFPMPFGIISHLSMRWEKCSLYTAAMAGAVPAVVLVLVLANAGAWETLFGLFYLASIIALVETANFKKGELKKWVSFRTGFESAKAAFLVLGIGLFVVASLDGLENRERGLAELEETITKLSKTQESGGEAARINAELLLGNQQQTIKSITSLPPYKTLEAKEDADVQAFVLAMNSIEEQAFSVETMERAIQQITEAQRKNRERLTLGYLREQIPLIDALAEHYWLANALGAVFMFLFYANIIAANLAGFYAALLSKAFAAGHQKV